MTGYAVVFMFFLTAILCFLERYIGKYKLPLYIGIGLILILIAASRIVGMDPDSSNYESSFLSIRSFDNDYFVEYTFVIVSMLIHFFSDDVHFLLLFYAIVGVTTKFIAFRQLSEFWFLPVVVYIGYFFIFHECMQIRTGILSGMFLLSIKPLAEGKRLKAFWLILIGFFFHYSAIMLLPILFLSNKRITLYGKLFWALIIPVGYFFYFNGLSWLLTTTVDIPYFGDKLAMYQIGAETGKSLLAVNVFSPLYMFTIFLYLYILYFHDTIIEHNKYFPILIKILGLGIMSYTVFSIFPALAQRVNLLLRIVSIILYSNIFYTIKPKWAATSVVIIVAFVFLNYAVPSISFHLFWDPGVFF